MSKHVLLIQYSPPSIFNKAVSWIRSQWPDAKVTAIIKVHPETAELDREELDRVFVTGNKFFSFDGYEAPILEYLRDHPVDVLVLPYKFRTYHLHIAAFALRHNIPKLALFAENSNVKVIQGFSIRYYFLERLVCGLPRALKQIWAREESPETDVATGSFDPVFARIVHRKYQEGGFKLAPGDFGFVQNDPPIELSSLEPSDRLRIVLLGGSSAYGVGLNSASETITSQLARRLREQHGIEADVLNYGVPGGWSRTESALLIYKLIYAKPSVVISFSGWNDFITQFVAHRYGPGCEVLNWSFHDYYNYLYFHARHEIETPFPPFAEKDGISEKYPYFDKHCFPESGQRLQRDLWGTNLEIMATVCAQFDIPFLGILQPHALGQPSLDEEWLKSTYLSNFRYFYVAGHSADDNWREYKREIAERWELYQSLLKRLSERCPKGIFGDFSNLFVEDPEVAFVNCIHYNKHGTSVIAEEIMRLLEKGQLLVRYRAETENLSRAAT